MVWVSAILRGTLPDVESKSNVNAPPGPLLQVLKRLLSSKSLRDLQHSRLPQAADTDWKEDQHHQWWMRWTVSEGGREEESVCDGSVTGSDLDFIRKKLKLHTIDQFGRHDLLRVPASGRSDRISAPEADMVNSVLRFGKVINPTDSDTFGEGVDSNRPGERYVGKSRALSV